MKLILALVFIGLSTIVPKVHAHPSSSVDLVGSDAKFFLNLLADHHAHLYSTSSTSPTISIKTIDYDATLIFSKIENSCRIYSEAEIGQSSPQQTIDVTLSSEKTALVQKVLLRNHIQFDSLNENDVTFSTHCRQTSTSDWHNHDSSTVMYTCELVTQ